MPNLKFLILFQRADAFIDQRFQRPGFRPRMLSYFLIEKVPKERSFFLRQIRQFFEDFLNSHVIRCFHFRSVTGCACERVLDPSFAMSRRCHPPELKYVPAIFQLRTVERLTSIATANSLVLTSVSSKWPLFPIVGRNDLDRNPTQKKL
jgi:hypothetical protein